MQIPRPAPILIYFTVVLMVACGALAYPHPAQSTRIVDIHGRHIVFFVIPGKLPALVLDAGGGSDSSYWNGIIPALAARTGSEIITYDWAGLGASDEAPPPFDMKNSVADLEAGLEKIGATRELVLVPHSFAGEIATYLAIRHPAWIAGAVLVDTNVPDFFSDAEINHLDPIVRPMVAAGLAAHADKRTRTLEAIEESYVPTSTEFHKMAWPAAIPCYVIESETTPFPPVPELKIDSDRWRQAHAEFARRAPNRVLVVAKGSSHDIAHDRPAFIVDAVARMVDGLRSGRKNPAQ